MKWVGVPDMVHSQKSLLSDVMPMIMQEHFFSFNAEQKYYLQLTRGIYMDENGSNQDKFDEVAKHLKKADRVIPLSFN